MGTKHSCNTLPGATSDEDPLLDRGRSSECSIPVPPLSQEDDVDDLIRAIDIIKPNEHESTRRAQMLIDSGNPHENLISSKLVDELCLPHSQKKPSFARRIWNKLAPWTRAGKLSRDQAEARLRNFDGTIVKGQNGTVTISWFGKNRSDLGSPIVYFQPRRYKTTHVIVDAKMCSADVVLSWKEVKSLGLRQRFAAAIQKPPTAKPDPDGKDYDHYERRRAEKKAVRDEMRGNGQSQPPAAGSTTQTGQARQSST